MSRIKVPSVLDHLCARNREERVKWRLANALCVEFKPYFAVARKASSTLTPVLALVSINGTPYSYSRSTLEGEMGGELRSRIGPFTLASLSPSSFFTALSAAMSDCQKAEGGGGGYSLQVCTFGTCINKVAHGHRSRLLE